MKTGTMEESSRKGPCERASTAGPRMWKLGDKWGQRSLLLPLDALLEGGQRGQTLRQEPMGDHRECSGPKEVRVETKGRR